MALQVILAASAARAIRKLEAKTSARVLANIRALALEPFPPDCKKLSGYYAHRVRVGDYRVVYRVREEQGVLEVLKVGHRREVYERLDELR